MRRILTPLAFFIAGIVCIGCPQSIFGQAARAIPSWLVNYPGVTAQSSTSPGYFELTYEAAAKPEELIAHYRKLFAAQGLNFQPNFDGIGTAIRGETRECDLLLLIRRQGAGSWVQVSGAAKSMVRVGSPAPRITAVPSLEERTAQQREHTRQVLQNAEEKHKEQIRGMEKYDKPVYPRPKAPPPPLVWPLWLGQTDGSPLDIQRGVDQFGRKFLKGSFTTDSPRRAIQTFYADLLNSHGYTIRTQSIPAWPPDRKAWLEGEHHSNGTTGPRFVIRIELTPAGETVRVDFRMIAYP